jgi:hypothetical protein
MNQLNDPLEAGMPKKIYYGLIGVVVVLLSMWLFLPRQESATQDKSQAKAIENVTDRECERRLTEIMNGLHPQQVVIHSSRAERTAELGQWMLDCGKSIAELSPVKVDEAINAKYLFGPALERSTAEGFTQRDAHHLTLAQLLQEIARDITKSESPSDQAVAAFDYVVREIQLEPEPGAEPNPRTPLEALLLGRGSAEVRAWAFAELLRQLHLDAVLIEPKSKPDQWLIGVLRSDGDAWLFDPRMGLPVPAADDDGQGLSPRRAATLGEVRKDPSLLRRLDTEQHPYPLQEGDLATVAVKMIGHSSVFSARIARLQSMLANPIEAFDGLGESSLRAPGLASRTAAAGKDGLWNEADVSVWSYPEETLDAFIQSGGELSDAWSKTTDLFAGPTVFTRTAVQLSMNENDVDYRQDVTKSSIPLRVVRMTHLSGNYYGAGKDYLPIRTANRPKLIPEDPVLAEKLRLALGDNNKLADYALYWMALAQFEQRSNKTSLNALQTLRQYSNDFPLGLWKPDMPELQARILISLDRRDEALKALEDNFPRQVSPRRAYLIARLKKNQAQAPPATEAKPESSPSTADPASNPPAGT